MRARGLAPALGALLSLLAFSPELRSQDGSGESPDPGLQESRIRQALEETLSQPEFARLRSPPPEQEEKPPAESPQWLQSLARWLHELFGTGDGEESASPPSWSLPALEVLLYAMAALVLVGVILFAIQSARASSRDKRVDRDEQERARIFLPGAAPGELSPEEYWRRALQHGEEKRFKDAIRELLLGAMSATERRGLVRFRRGLTNRDYLYAVRGPARDSFARICAAFELVYFGRRDATSEAFRECCREFQKSFQGAGS